ncbi:MAG: Na+/H+ antiporter NhaC, partial [Acidobacteriota bacterium]|nr:Na+/H+ antiporter NhaC [Acidobacteriota bacterium]
MSTLPPRTPTLLWSLVPVLVLIGLLSSAVALFGEGASSGANPIALVLSAGVGMLIGTAHGHA